MSQGPAGHVTRSFIRPEPETAGGCTESASEGSSRGVLRKFLRTADGVTIDAAYEPAQNTSDTSGTSDASAGSGAAEPGTGLVIVVAHGFTGDLERPHVRRAAKAFARYAAVVTFSFRGHGASGGRSTVGDREVLDLAAAVEWARELGHTRVATVGFSMGGSVVLRHAALHAKSDQEHEGRTGAHSDAVVSVSAPARWYYRGTAPMRRLHWLVTRPVGRAVGRYGLRTRIHHRDWDPVPSSPVESVPLIAPTPLLIVHGDRDGYFPVDHPRMLAAASGDHADLWLEPGMGHAENAADDALLSRIGEWAAAHAG
ncbi:MULTISPECIES: alpha/beta hydrolase family protein [Streptomyces]|uniref:alpha/beta hydrolase family protein n=1 Tax=Streptomyces sp. LRE541 TaxID=2931983 RepID=UPI00200BD255|nr:alpha/beta fold hydrolase [Streptomyces sp. LRE541]UPZ29886.1 alpha/beta hydrolase [Streptomyces sp. LRE541]